MVFVAVFIRRGANGKSQLVLLDHGLYDSLSETNRVSLCKLYKAIILRDEDSMAKYSQQLGVQGQSLWLCTGSIGCHVAVSGCKFCIWVPLRLNHFIYVMFSARETDMKYWLQ